MYDINRIKEQFCDVIRYSQTIPEPKVDTLFADWEIAKEKFIERFGGLIYEWPTPIEFTFDENEKRCRAADFANRVYDTFNNPVLAEFIDENIDGFFDNKVVKVVPNSEIPVGMKLLKAFKYFEFDSKVLRNIQDMASQLIQENKIKGTLCFSVHPLDFLSSSENTYNWRSCHALDGEFRAGNLSYMTDKTTFMVYLKGADGVKLPNFGGVEWNSKKWRMLVHAAEDDELIFAGRQYPFSSKSGIDTVLNIYNNLCQKENCWSYVKYGEWRADYVNSYAPYDASPDVPPKALHDRYAVISGHLMPIHDLVVQDPEGLNYNDVLNSTCYQFPYFGIYNPHGYHSPQSLRKKPITIGHRAHCLHCEERLISNPETMRCDDCELLYGVEENENYGSCACCGRRMYIDDSYIVGDCEEFVCYQCFHSECFVCDSCDQAYYNEDKFYCVETETYICKHCHDSYNEIKRGRFW